jgi:hypothetical protein
MFLWRPGLRIISTMTMPIDRRRSRFASSPRACSSMPSNVQARSRTPRRRAEPLVVKRP